MGGEWDVYLLTPTTATLNIMFRNIFLQTEFEMGYSRFITEFYFCAPCGASIAGSIAGAGGSSCCAACYF